MGKFFKSPLNILYVVLVVSFWVSLYGLFNIEEFSFLLLVSCMILGFATLLVRKLRNHLKIIESIKNGSYQHNSNNKHYSEYPEYMDYMSETFTSLLKEIMEQGLYSQKEIIKSKIEILKLTLNAKFLVSSGRILTMREINEILELFNRFVETNYDKSDFTSYHASGSNYDKSLKFLFETEIIEEYMKTEEAIKKQYRKMAKRLHPDRPNGSESGFQELQQYYEVLRPS